MDFIFFNFPEKQSDILCQEILSQLSLLPSRKLEGKESQVQPKNCLDFEFGSWI